MQQNPACPNGYTCDAGGVVGPGAEPAAEPTPAPPSGGVTCADDPACSSYLGLFGQAAAAGAGPCLSWPQSILDFLTPPLAPGTTLDGLCPVSCQACGPPAPPAGVSACLSNPCQNGGVCADRVDGTYSCTCTLNPQTQQPLNWGINCEASEDDCTLQHVTCEQTPRTVCVDCARRFPPSSAHPFGAPNPACTDGYTCECPVGMEGAECAVDTDECASSPCQNGGACGDSNSHNGLIPVRVFQCVCPQGWYGETCETDADECTALAPVPGGPDGLNAMTCLGTETCIDCDKVTGGKMGKPARANPDCPNGYTCETGNGIGGGGHR
jgi:hypothetical protein